MKVKHAVILFAVMLALASAAAIGVVLPSTYPTPPAVTPQQTVPAAPNAPIPVAPSPGHPGGIYTQVAATCYGPITITKVQVSNAAINADTHISLDHLSAYTSFAAPVRQTVKVTFTIQDKRLQHDGDVNMVYVTVSTQPGVEVDISSANSFHVSPGVWVIGTNGPGNTTTVTLSIYGQPISSGDRTVTVTFTAE